ncbi:MjaI restriction endonuclease [Leptospira santarosai]|uniref:MjaI restriction endonuclease n=1 Tax=Leptospira santarosai TaxID=28183 RepID=A0A2P1QWR8_9LEPT|nr:MjaI restriction endonuclease [Leptospira santarosai]
MSKKQPNPTQFKKDWYLNRFTNLFGINRKKSIGDLEHHISKALPTSLDNWEEYFYSNIHSKESLDELGKKLYERIQEKVLPAVQSILEIDCINYIRDLGIPKTFQGYIARLQIVQKQLKDETGIEFQYKPDFPNDWRFKTFEVDLYYQDNITHNLVAIKILPRTFRDSQDPIIIQTKSEIEAMHKDIIAKDGGNFFIFYYNTKKQNFDLIKDENYHKMINLFR